MTASQFTKSNYKIFVNETRNSIWYATDSRKNMKQEITFFNFCFHASFLLPLSPKLSLNKFENLDLHIYILLELYNHILKSFAGPHEIQGMSGPKTFKFLSISHNFY